MPVTLIRQNLRRGASIADVSGRVFTFDATLSEQHEETAQSTDHPAEEGIDFSDHIQLKPTTVRLSGVVSNTPVMVDGELLPDRATTAFDLLREMMAAKELMTVTTGIGVYDNMALLQVSTPRGPATGRNALQFAVQFKQQRLVSPQFVKVSLDEVSDREGRGTPDSAASETERGAQEADATEEEEERSRSWLAQGFDFVFG